MTRVTADPKNCIVEAEKGFGWTVYLNDEKVEKCVTFDTEEGWVEVYVLDDDGHIIRFDEGSPRIERRYGIVTAEPPT